MTFRSEELDDFERITLEVPPLNALDLPAVEALGRRFRARAQDRPLLLTGAGGAFSAGVDVKAFAAYDMRERRAFFDAITAMVTALCAIEAPVLAALNGHALGGGFVLALCADYRFAAEGDAKFGLTEAQAGVPFPDGASAVVAAELPPSLLRHMTLSSAVLSADDLHSHLVIDAVVASDALQKKSAEALARLAAQPAFAAVKSQTRGPLRQRLSELG